MIFSSGHYCILETGSLCDSAMTEKQPAHDLSLPNENVCYIFFMF